MNWFLNIGRWSKKIQRLKFVLRIMMGKAFLQFMNRLHHHQSIKKAISLRLTWEMAQKKLK